jgi:hypothetical protein
MDLCSLGWLERATSGPRARGVYPPSATAALHFATSRLLGIPRLRVSRLTTERGRDADEPLGRRPSKSVRAAIRETQCEPRVGRPMALLWSLEWQRMDVKLPLGRLT